MSEREIEELKAIMNIIPTDKLTTIKLIHAVETFRIKYPKIYRELTENDIISSRYVSHRSLSDVLKDLIDQVNRREKRAGKP